MELSLEAQRATAMFLHSDNFIDQAFREPTQLGQRFWAGGYRIVHGGVEFSDRCECRWRALALRPIPEHAQIYTEQRDAVKEYFQDRRNSTLPFVVAIDSPRKAGP